MQEMHERDLKSESTQICNIDENLPSPQLLCLLVTLVPTGQHPLTVAVPSPPRPPPPRLCPGGSLSPFRDLQPSPQGSGRVVQHHPESAAPGQTQPWGTHAARLGLQGKAESPLSGCGPVTKALEQDPWPRLATRAGDGGGTMPTFGQGAAEERVGRDNVGGLAVAWRCREEFPSHWFLLRH